jgi:hypothetical protein
MLVVHMENHTSIDYMQDHEAIPNYQKEGPDAIAYKRNCFRLLAECLCSSLSISTHLDIGCGSGYLVESMRDLGIQSFGAEIGYMYHHGLFPEVEPYIYESNIFQLGSIGKHFDLVSAMEVLEHLYAENFHKNDLNSAIISLISATNRYIFLTMPILNYSYCPWLDWNGRNPQLWPRILRPDEVPLNKDGTPILGHVTLATEAWWRCKLESFGLLRLDKIEKRINDHLHRIDPGLLEWWHIFIYEKRTK